MTFPPWRHLLGREDQQSPSVKAGSLTILPPSSADWCAQRPTQVQLADWTALGNGSRSSDQRHGELVGQVRVAAAVAAALREAQVRLLAGVVDALASCISRCSWAGAWRNRGT